MRCPECASKDVAYNLGEQFCRMCGIVISDQEFMNPHLTQSQIDLATQPAFAMAGTGTIKGRIFKHSWLMSTREKSKQNAFSQIEDLASKLNLPKSVAVDAKLYYQTLGDQSLTVGRDAPAMLIATVYAACLQHNIPRTHLDFMLYSNVRKTDLHRALKFVCARLNIQRQNVNVEELILQNANKLGLSPQIGHMACEYYLRLKTKFEGRPAYVVAAVMIYITARLQRIPLTQRLVGFKTGIHEATLRKLVRHAIQCRVIPELNQLMVTSTE
jgi:transcription initiation factor TFIIB